MSTALPLSVIHRLFFIAALFLRPARAEVYVTGTPALIIIIVVLVLLIGSCVGAGCFFVVRRRKARAPQVFVPPQNPQYPIQGDQVPMLAPPQGPFTDASAVPTNTYAYAQDTGGYPQPQHTGGYPQTTGGYPQSTGYNPYPPAASHSDVSLGTYPHDDQ
ncbi:hypothetical protein B0H11DRAFT_1989370 [Mycena galericulata]|nr:hypothetical protein B0H11DRAFT_1989370 [Mycena galericulata]